MAEKQLSERNFKGVWIPKEIWISKDLTLQEKVFLVEIDVLDNEDGCFAGNEHFSIFFGISKSRCSEVIKSLERKGYISVKYIYKNNTKAIEKRVLKINKKKYFGIRETEEVYSENRIGVFEKLKDNNISSSNIGISNNTITEKVSVDRIVDTFNSICVSLPKVIKITENRRKAVKKLLKDFTEEDFKTVCIKCEESDFLSGKRKPWRADFDWILNQKNFVRILEDSYSNNKFDKKVDLKNVPLPPETIPQEPVEEPKEQINDTEDDGLDAFEAMRLWEEQQKQRI